MLATLEPVDGVLSVARSHRRLVESVTVGGAQPPDLATVYPALTALVEQVFLHALAVVRIALSVPATKTDSQIR